MNTTTRRNRNFNQACAFKIDFPPFQGQTLDDIAKTDRGLRYLDNLNGKMRSPNSPLARALNDYLTDPVIAKELDDLIATSSERYEQR